MWGRKYLKDKVYQTSQWLELIISFVIVCAIIFYTVLLVLEFKDIVLGKSAMTELTEFINMGFGLVIGIEFVKMLCKHSPMIIVEVLMFAVARQMIVEHSTPLQNLCSIACIAMLFAIRRFLFFPYDATERMEFPAWESMEKINRVMHVHVPIDKPEDTLYDVFHKHCTAEKIVKGTCVYFQECALRVTKIMDDEVMQIEVIRSAQADLIHDI